MCMPAQGWMYVDVCVYEPKGIALCVYDCV